MIDDSFLPSSLPLGCEMVWLTVGSAAVGQGGKISKKPGRDQEGSLPVLFLCLEPAHRDGMMREGGERSRRRGLLKSSLEVSMLFHGHSGITCAVGLRPQLLQRLRLA